jgi:hypothetical protein
LGRKIKRQEDNDHESRGTQTEKDCAADAQQQLKTTDPTSHQRGRFTQTRNYLKIIIERRKVVAGPGWEPDIKTD